MFREPTIEVVVKNKMKVQIKEFGCAYIGYMHPKDHFCSIFDILNSAGGIEDLKGNKV